MLPFLMTEFSGLSEINRLDMVEMPFTTMVMEHGPNSQEKLLRLLPIRTVKFGLSIQLEECGNTQTVTGL